MVGKLMEVDLPVAPSSRTPDAAPPQPKKQRLGPDGKPWRGRRRRGSDDIKRDQLVEEFLHENKREY
jgi:hypothetical protein